MNWRGIAKCSDFEFKKPLPFQNSKKVLGKRLIQKPLLAVYLINYFRKKAEVYKFFDTKR